jgi:L-threonylcarbamoyladenylate synthase
MNFYGGHLFMENRSGSDQVYLYPTDTVWGMGSNIFSKNGYQQILALKGAREDKPFSIMFSSIEQIKEFFVIPLNWDISELEKVLKMECTLGFLKKWAKKEIPPWLTSDSPFIAFRCLDNPEIKYIIEKENAPITTTSLNRSNLPPATSLEEAKIFEKDHQGLCELINFSNGKLSGNPSTIVFFEDEKKFKIHRMGKNGEEIEKRLRLFSA